MIHPKTSKEVSVYLKQNKHLLNKDKYYDLLYWLVRELASYPKRKTYPRNVQEAKNILKFINDK